MLNLLFRRGEEKPSVPITVIIPAFNELSDYGSPLIGVLNAFNEYSMCPNNPHSLEVIVVDDGSTDLLANQGNLANQDNLSGAKVLHQPNLGKAEGVGHGVYSA